MSDRTFEELQDLILCWAAKRGILEVSQKAAIAQLGKVVEEVSELSNAIYSDNQVEVIDAIGDVLVTVITTSANSGIDPVDALDGVWEVIRHRTGKTKDGVFIKD